MTPVLELQDLHVLLCTHRHQGVELVKGVSFSVYPGECLGILGESGSGKSMSMKAAMGLLDHSFHVLGSAKFQGEELLGRSDEELRRLILKELSAAGLLHDIGKLNLPLDLLEKAGPLSEEEYETMKTHSELGYERLKENINISSKTKMGVYMHHENVNGSGYPLGLRDDQIYMFAKIIHIADVYDAITSERPYKKAQSPKEAIEFLMNNAGKMFQPEYVKAFITYIPVYPKGRNVILSDGNVAVVVENRQYHTLYPVVRRLSEGETIDLADQNENLSDPLSILDFER